MMKGTTNSRDRDEDDNKGAGNHDDGRGDNVKKKPLLMVLNMTNAAII